MSVIDPKNPMRRNNTPKTRCTQLCSLNGGGFARCRKKDCEACFNHWLRHWEMRLGAEAFVSKMVLFSTLTFRDESLEMAVARAGDHTLFKQYIQNLRRAGYAIKYVAAFEYGTKTGRPHYHAILCFGSDGKWPDMPLDVRADLPHWRHGFSKYEIPRSRSGALQYTLGYVSKGGGTVLTPSNNFGKRFLLNYAEMQGRNNRPLMRATRGHWSIPVQIAGMIVKAKGIDGNGMVRKYEFPVSHPWTADMLGGYLASYRDRFGNDPPSTYFRDVAGNY